MPPTAHLHAIGTATPPHDMHAKFVAFAPRLLPPREAGLFARMAERAGIAHRYSVLAPHPAPDAIDQGGVYRPGAFPDTAQRMRLFVEHALPLALRAIGRLDPAAVRRTTHLVLSCCTGFTAPGLDLRIAEALGLDRGVERTVVGFMGCSAALNALKLARHQVRSDPGATVLVVNLELCTLHLRDVEDLAQVLSFLIFADGCAAALVGAEPRGIALDEFTSFVIPDTSGHITWAVGQAGFEMELSGALPGAVAETVRRELPGTLGGLGPGGGESLLWAVHPGGKSILDAVERGLGHPGLLADSRAVLRDYGNMSSPTVMFVLDRLLRDPARTGPGRMLAFGPGVTVEAARFRKLAA